MSSISNLKRLSLGAAIVVSPLGSLSVPSSACANGPSRAVARRLQGKYPDAPDSDGTVYGKCSQFAQTGLKNRLKLAR